MVLIVGLILTISEDTLLGDIHELTWSGMSEVGRRGNDVNISYIINVKIVHH